LDYYAARVAVITGAGSGIGRALALRLASRRARLALLDRDADSVAQTAQRCEEAGAKVRAHTVDVTDREALLRCSSGVQEEFGRVDLIFCTAGVIHTGSLLSSDFADIDRVIGINLLGTVNTAKAFLPHAIASGGGHVVLFSSGFGLIAAPRYSAYSASKFAIRGLAESLRQEMALDGHPVSVTCVIPGGIRTPIVRNGSFATDVDAAAVTAAFEEKAARTDAAKAASVILRRVEQGRAQAFVGLDARAAALVARAAGGAYPRVFGWIIRGTRRRRRS
jgi:short-subunit dehydrogenase